MSSQARAATTREEETRPASRRCRLLPLALPLAIFLWAGLRGLDFGTHWDEQLHTKGLAQAVREGTLLPPTYNYPSVTFWLCAAALTPEATRELDLTRRGAPVFLESLARFARGPEYSLRARGLFVVATGLALVLVYLFVLRWRRSWVEALCAAAILGTSFEVGYHARWISPDPLLVTLAAASLVCTGSALLRGSARGWLTAAAVVAGLACGTKYQAGILFVPVLGAAWLRARERPREEGRSRSLARLIATFGATYLATTPGTLLRPIAFVQDLRFELRHYRTGHYGFTVEGGLDHLARALRYVAESLLSQSAPIALLLLALALLGLWASWRESRPLAIFLAGVPLFLLLYMCQFRVLFVRNLIWIAPFLAVAAARGAAWIAERLRPGRARLAFGGLLAALLLLNAYQLVAAGESIRWRGTDRFARELADYIEAHEQQRFYLSPAVAEELARVRPSARSNVTTDPREPSDAVAFYPRELEAPGAWPANMPGFTLRIFGPREVNFEYYATWPEPRILLVRRAQAVRLGLLEG